MFKVQMKDVTIHRFCQPLYGLTQATPQSFILDPACTDAIVPGTVMCLGKPSELGATSSDNIPESQYSGAMPYVTVCKGADQEPLGLSELWGDPTICDEIRSNGTNTISVWVGSNDAQFRLTREESGRGAFTATAEQLATAKTDLTAGKSVYLIPDTTGKVTFAAVDSPATKKFLKLVDIISQYEIVVRFA